MFAKVDVNGKNAHPVFTYLKNNSELYNSKKRKADELPWNFCKFILDRQGQVVKYIEPQVEPYEARVMIEQMTAFSK